MTALATWPHEAEFRRLLRQCCDGQGISASEFDRLLEMTRHPLPDAEAQAELVGLVQLMQRECVGAWS
jgi:hypothetical protein